MSRGVATAITGLLGVAALATSVSGAPEAVNARVVQQRVDGGLAATVHALAGESTGPLWTSWSAPLIEGDHRLCCGEEGRYGRAGTCDLEHERSFSIHHGDDRRARPDVAVELTVYLRLEGGRVDRVRALGSDCVADVNGLPLHRLRGVRAAEGIDFLAGLVRSGPEQVAEGALGALAFLDDAAAFRALEGFARSSTLPERRENAAFWLGIARGADGLEVLRRLAASERDREVREGIAMAIGVSETPGAARALIALAREDDDPRIRSAALFWLGQKAEQQVGRVLREAVDRDPDAEVKREAVFAISQLPPDEGVPLLIELAREHRSFEVRKTALFWLGQSGDDRALALFEEILAD